MFLTPIEFFERMPDIRRLHKGTVIDNIDPERLGRLKVEVKGILEGDKKNLPWVMPISSSALGGNPDSSTFIVPEIGADLVIEFPDALPYFGYYIGFWQNRVTHHVLANVDYPDSYAFRDKTNNFILVNKEKNYFYLEHSSGTKLQVIENGATLLDVKDNYYVNVEKDMHFRVKGDRVDYVGGNYSQMLDKDLSSMVGGDMLHEVSGQVSNKSSKYTIKTGPLILDGDMSNTNSALAQPPPVEEKEWPLDPVDIIELDAKYRVVTKPSKNVE